MSDTYKWGMVIDVDRCTGCQACVVACQAENNIPINEEQRFVEHRAKEWIRIERYWEGEFPNVKARFLPVLCQHCENAPCEPVCPVNAIQHNSDGLNVQVYNRCVGTRYCGNNCPYNVRFFNFWEPDWAEPLGSQLNPDVTVRGRGIMEKCTFCVQRINRVKRDAARSDRTVRDGELQPACAQACPTDALVFGNWKDPASRINALATQGRAYHLLEELGTGPAVVYLKAVAPAAETAGGALRASEVETAAPAERPDRSIAGDASAERPERDVARYASAQPREVPRRPERSVAGDASAERLEAEARADREIARNASAERLDAEGRADREIAGDASAERREVEGRWLGEA